MIMTESEMDEQLDIIGDFWEEQERLENEYDARQAEIEEAYQQGRADQKKEDNEFFNFDKVIEIEKNKSYQQGAREFAEWCLKHNVDFSNCKDSDCDKCIRTICRNAKTYVDIVLAEWQKGAENE